MIRFKSTVWEGVKIITIHCDHIKVAIGIEVHPLEAHITKGSMLFDQNLALKFSLTSVQEQTEVFARATVEYSQVIQSILIKVIDIFGNDTSQAFEVEVK